MPVKTGELGLAVPYVAFDEMIRHRALLLIEAQAKDRMRDELTNPKVLIDRMAREWIGVFMSCGVQFLRLEAGHLAEARRRERETLPPFKNRNGRRSENDFRDALIFCAVATAKEANQRLVFGCADKVLREAVEIELGIPVRKNCNKLLEELLGNDGKIVADPFKVASPEAQLDLAKFKADYSHTEFELIHPERSHNRFDIDAKLNAVTAEFRDQICVTMAVSLLLQPAFVDETVAKRRSQPPRTCAF